MTAPTRDKPWLIRTYAGHSTAKASNALYRGNLAKGQTGLSVAFDLPTQTGYDSDHVLARGEVGKVGVPICHLGDMRSLFADIPLEQMNTSMTINATAPWLLALYIAVAEEQGADIAQLQGTVQNDLIKEYLSRGTYVCPPKPSLRMIGCGGYCYTNVPKWNPMNGVPIICKRPARRPSRNWPLHCHRHCLVDELRPRVRKGFPCSGGPHFVFRQCRHPLRDRDVQDARLRRPVGRNLRERYASRRRNTAASPLRRAGEFVGLTEQQPENNVTVS